MIKIGLFGIGLNTYWDQFDGLLENLKDFQQQISVKIESFDVDVINAGIVDNLEKEQETADFLKCHNIEIVLTY